MVPENEDGSAGRYTGEAYDVPLADSGNDSAEPGKPAAPAGKPESMPAQAPASYLPPLPPLPSGNDPACLARMSGWNWGACAFHGIWMYCFGMQLAGILVFLSTCFIPCASLVVPIYLGIKGDDLAWRYRHFENFDQFREITGIWNKWGIGFIVIVSVLAVGISAFICWYLWQFVQMLTPQMGI